MSGENVKAVRKIRVKTESIYHWSTVDWSMINSRIAEKLGCSRERVRQQRKRYDPPKLGQVD